MTDKLDAFEQFFWTFTARKIASMSQLSATKSTVVLCETNPVGSYSSSVTSCTLLEFISFLPNQPCSLDKLLPTPHPWRVRSYLDVSFFEHYLKQNTNCPKFIYVLRNPKDVLNSFYQLHTQLPYDFSSVSFNDFFEMFKRKQLLFGDPIDHLLGWWKYNDHPNILFIHYEDMLADPAKVITRMAHYLGHSYSKEEIQAIIDNTSYEKMKSQPHSDYFATPIEDNYDNSIFRGGKRGGWQKVFSDDQNAYIASLLKQKTDPVGLKYQF